MEQNKTLTTKKHKILCCEVSGRKLIKQESPVRNVEEDRNRERVRSSSEIDIKSMITENNY